MLIDEENAIVSFIPINQDNRKDKISYNEEVLNGFISNNQTFQNQELVEYAVKNFKEWLEIQRKIYLYFKNINVYNLTKEALIENIDNHLIEKLKQKKVTISGKNWDELPDRKLPLAILSHLDNRFSLSRAKKLRKRMAWLSYKHRKTKSVLLTLTIDPKKYNYDYIKITSIANKELNRFMTNLRYHLKKEGREMPEYLKAPEYMTGREENDYISKGLIHFHIVFFGASRLLDWREIRKIWKLGHVWINRTCENKKIRKPIDYITKYITKSVDLKNKKMMETQAMNWMFSVRNYSNSRGLIYPLYYKKDVKDYDLDLAICVKNDNWDGKTTENMMNSIEEYLPSFSNN